MRRSALDRVVVRVRAAVNKDSKPGDRDFIPVTRDTIGAEDGEAVNDKVGRRLGIDNASSDLLGSVVRITPEMPTPCSN